MCDGTFSHHCSKKSISTTCGIPQCGTYSKKSKSTTSFYVVLVPHGICEMVLIALTVNSGGGGLTYTMNQKASIAFKPCRGLPTYVATYLISKEHHLAAAVAAVTAAAF